MFSTVWNTQRYSQSYIQKRRGRREIDVTKRRRGEVKREESNLDSNQLPIGSPQPGTHREFTEFHREQKREEGDRGDQEEKRGVKRRETDLANNQLPKCSSQPGIPKEIYRVG